MHNQKLDSLQVLRGFAACAVVLHHALRALTVKLPDSLDKAGSAWAPSGAFVELGAMGVDVFFILSGFLMVYIAEPYFAGRRSPLHFLKQRLFRIWPLYAFVTAFMCAQLAFEALQTGTLPFDLTLARLGSFIFLPSFNENGLLQPILGVGWTLNYEMYFYLLFAAILVSGPRFAVLKLGVALATAFLVGLLLPPSAVGVFLSNPIVFEFLLGALVAAGLTSKRFRPRYPAAWISAGVGLALLFALTPDALTPNGWNGSRVLYYGAPALLIFIGFLAFAPNMKWPHWIRLIGDASYSIYLVHILVIYRVAFRIFPVVEPSALSQMSIVIAASAALVASIVAGLATYFLIERPVVSLLRKGSFDLNARRMLRGREA